MVIKQKVAYGIVKSIEELWQGQELLDFAVVVEGTEVLCHRFLLGACSKFFRALFRSGMKEVSEQRVFIPNISNKTFDFIMKAMYTGCDVLTDENIFDIWHAANQLQIQFLVTECEALAISNISVDTYEKTYKHAKMLDSPTVLNTILDFIKKNFEDCWKSETFLGLEFEELLSIVESQNLKVSSEDIVIESIVKWVFCDAHQDVVMDREVEEANESQENKVKETFAKGDQGIEDSNTGNASSKAPDSTVEDKEEKIAENGEGQKLNMTPGLILKENAKTDEISVKPLSSHSDTLQCPNDVPIPNQNQDKTFQLPFTFENKLSTCSVPADNIKIPGNRRHHLERLMKSTRICLASPTCLEKMYRNNLIMESQAIKNIVTDAIFYQLVVNRRHGQWPTAALHRNGSSLENMAVYYYINASVVRVYSLFEDEHFVLKCLPVKRPRYVLMTVFDNKLYILYGCPNGSNFSVLLVYSEEGWDKIGTIPERSQATCVPCGNFIYTFGVSGQRVQKFDPCCKKIVTHTCAGCPDEITVTSVIEFEEKILVFSSPATNETAVHCFDTHSETWIRLNNFEGPSQKIISVKVDSAKYIIQTNGSIWRLVIKNESFVDFKFRQKLWTAQHDLFGGVFYQNELYLLGDKGFEDVETECFVTEFGSEIPISVHTVGVATVGYLPIIMPKAFLSEAKS